MATLDAPKLRPLAARAVSLRGVDCVRFDDSLGLVDPGTAVTAEFYRRVLAHCDGRTNVDALAASAAPIPPGEVRDALRRLDAALVLDGPSLGALRRRYAAEPIRPAVFAGRSYPADPSALSSRLDAYLAEGRTISPPTGPLRGILSPHIDFDRGGPAYGAAYAVLADRPGADVFVILGVAHQYCGRRFALTRKHFSTPLGTASTDVPYVDALAEIAGAELFDDELAHRTEHSIEFQVVFLQHIMGSRPFTVVPILVGSFRDLMRAGVPPIDDPSVRRMVDALREVERSRGGRVCTVGAVDMSHVGPEFGDDGPADDRLLARVQDQDLEMLGCAARGDAAGWQAVAARTRDRYRVCGLDAVYTMLRAIGPTRGRVLRYDRAVNPPRTCAVSFAAVALDGTTDER